MTDQSNGEDLTKPFDFADVTFLVEDKPIYYNRCTLAMHSPHFKRLFYGAHATYDKEIRLRYKKFEDILAMLKLLKLNPHSSEQLITDENVEELLILAEEYQLRHVTAECESFLLINWKFDKSKIVRGLKLAARFGLKKASANMLTVADGTESIITDDNIEQLLGLSKEYGLFDIRIDCEIYMIASWPKKTEKALRAVEIAYELRLPTLARIFVPLAARRPMKEIERSRGMLSPELFRAILDAKSHQEFVEQVQLSAALSSIVAPLAYGGCSIS